MHRTEGTYNVANLFTDGPPGTTVEEDWLNAIQEEICKVIEGAGYPPKTAGTDTRNQLRTAIASLIAPASYGNIMTGNETFITNPGGDHLRCFLDPGGANRNFNPSGVFPSGFKVEIVNTGVEIITFDSAASAQNIGPGQ